MIKRLKSDNAFMGPTHALSGLAIFLLIVALIPGFGDNYLNSNSLWVLIIATLTTVGAALLPDLDNTSSTVRNSLGIVGSVISTGFRATSLVMQSTIRTRKDDANPDPHRGFWHTFVASIIFGLVTWFLTNIQTELTLPLFGTITIGFIIAFFLSFILVHLALTALIASSFKKLKKSFPFGEVLSFAISFTLTFLLFLRIPSDVNFLWLSISITLGMMIHILGDAMTVSGVPFLWPIPIRGKMWWNIRFTKMKAGGTLEKSLFIPMFTIIAVVSLIIIVKNGVFA